MAVSARLGFRRHYRRTLESEDTRPRTGSNRRSNRLVRSTEERAIFQFSGETLARSRKHQVFLVTYLSVGIALAVNSATTVHAGEMVLSEDGARAPPFLIAFFVISGLQARFSIPGRTRFQLALPHYRSAMGGNLAQRHS
jgi:hypothetical protein